MAGKRELELRVILKAFDRMSSVVKESVSKSQAALQKLQKSSDAYGKSMQSAGLNAMGMGTATAYAMAKPIQAFAAQEAASERLASTMLRDGNRMNEYYKDVNNLAIRLGNELPGTSADLQDMMTSLMRNGVQAQDVLNGMGEATAKLAVVLEMGYAETAVFSSKLGKAAGIASQDMMKFLDIISRTATLGVKTEEMQYAFSKSSSALSKMGLSGLEASKSVAALYGSLIQAGASGETVGTGMTSMFNAMVNTDKMRKFNDELAKVGLGAMKFTDSKGNFAGIENMIGQLDRLKQANLSSTQLTTIQEALLGPGQDANFLGQMIANGTDGYNKIVQQMAGQANMQDKVNRQLGTLASKWDAATGTFQNAMAKFGETVGPDVKAVVDWIGKLSEAMMGFMQRNPELTRAIFMIGAGFAVLTSILGAGAFIIGTGARVIGVYASAFGAVGKLFAPGGFLSKAFSAFPAVLRAVGGAFTWLGRAMMAAGQFMLANPIILIIAAIAVAALLIYKYWDDIVPFFQKLWATVSAWFTRAWASITKTVSAAWQNIKAVVAQGLKVLWDLFTTFTPLGIFIKHFDAIWDFMKTLPDKFMKAGENIMNSLFEGMKAMANKPIEAMKETVGKMREYLPFSPAKVGPLRDIHRVKVVETIADAIKPAPALKAMQRVALGVATMAAPISAAPVAMAGQMVVSSAQRTAAPQGGSGVTINYNPTITITGSGTATQDDFLKQLKQHSREIEAILAKVQERNRTKSY